MSGPTTNTDRNESLWTTFADPDVSTAEGELGDVRVHAELQFDNVHVRIDMNAAVLLTAQQTLLYQPLSERGRRAHQHCFHLGI